MKGMYYQNFPLPILLQILGARLREYWPAHEVKNKRGNSGWALCKVTLCKLPTICEVIDFALGESA